MIMIALNIFRMVGDFVLRINAKTLSVFQNLECLISNALQNVFHLLNLQPQVKQFKSVNVLPLKFMILKLKNVLALLLMFIIKNKINV